VRAKFVATNDRLFNQCPTSLGMGLKWTDSNIERRKLEYLERVGDIMLKSFPNDAPMQEITC
jgi:hypothetical protein